MPASDNYSRTVLTLHGPKKSGYMDKIRVTAHNMGYALVERESCPEKQTIWSQVYPLMKTPHGWIYGGGSICRYLANNGNTSHSRVENSFDAGEHAADAWHEFIHEKLEIPIYRDGVVPKDVESTLSNIESYLGAWTFFDGNFASYADLAAYFVLKALPKRTFGPNTQRWQKTIAAMPGMVEYEKKAPNVPQPLVSDKSGQAGCGSTGTCQDTSTAQSFSLEDYKRTFSNCPDRSDKKFRQEFWDKTFDNENWSFWLMKYSKLDTECLKRYPTVNMMHGFCQRVEPQVVRSCMAMIHVIGEEGAYDIQGIWMCPGKEIPAKLKEHPSFEYNEWYKINTDYPHDRKIVEENFFFVKSGGFIDDRPIVETAQIK